MCRKKKESLWLYLVTSPLADGLLPMVCDAVRGGVTMVQLRDKLATDDQLYEQGRALLEVLAPAGVPLIVNDRLDVAYALGCGLHIGLGDAEPGAARSKLGSDAWLGITIHGDTGRARRYRAVADYVGSGPVFPTRTKPDAKSVLGTDALKRIVRDSPLPVVAIGGIGPDNIGLVRSAGPAGAAVCSSICSSEDPEAAASMLSRRY